jgi:hypothetical protein
VVKQTASQEEADSVLRKLQKAGASAEIRLRNPVSAPATIEALPRPAAAIAPISRSRPVKVRRHRFRAVLSLVVGLVGGLVALAASGLRISIRYVPRSLTIAGKVLIVAGLILSGFFMFVELLGSLNDHKYFVAFAFYAAVFAIIIIVVIATNTWRLRTRLSARIAPALKRR